jgi:hypothetical protein
MKVDKCPTLVMELNSAAPRRSLLCLLELTLVFEHHVHLLCLCLVFLFIFRNLSHDVYMYHYPRLFDDGSFAMKLRVPCDESVRDWSTPPSNDWY